MGVLKKFLEDAYSNKKTTDLDWVKSDPVSNSFDIIVKPCTVGVDKFFDQNGNLKLIASDYQYWYDKLIDFKDLNQFPNWEVEVIDGALQYATNKAYQNIMETYYNACNAIPEDYYSSASLNTNQVVCFRANHFSFYKDYISTASVGEEPSIG